MNRFRTQYRNLSPEEQTLVKLVKETAEQLELLYASLPAPREASLALTKLEESVMWAVKGVTR
jgi:hypothetical protein